MIRLPPRSPRTYTRLPYPTLCRSMMALTGIGGAPAIIAPLFVAIGSLGFSSPNAVATAMAPFPARAGIAAALIGTVQFTLAAISGSIAGHLQRSEEHTSELQSLMRISYAVFCLKKKKKRKKQ